MNSLKRFWEWFINLNGDEKIGALFLIPLMLLTWVVALKIIAWIIFGGEPTCV